MNTASYVEALGVALESQCELRDDNFVNPDFVLVFTEKTGELEEVAVIDLPLLYPLTQPGQRWSYANLGELVEAKGTLFRQSVVATELSDENPAATPLCGTVVLVDPIRPGPVSWTRVTAAITAKSSAG